MIEATRDEAGPDLYGPHPPAPDTPPLAGWHAYLVVGAAWLVLFGDKIYSSAAAFVGYTGGHLDTGWMDGWDTEMVGTAVAAVWALALTARHRKGLAVRVLLGVAVLALAAVPLLFTRSDPYDLMRIPWAGVAVWLAWQVTRAYGAGPGIAPRWAANPQGRRQAVVVFAISTFAFVATRYTDAILYAQTWLPQMPESQQETLGLDSKLQWMVSALSSAVAEESVTIGLAVTVLSLARRPRAEIITVCAAVAVSYHLYAGAPALAAAVFAATHAWLYLRTGRLTPIIASHLFVNVLGVLEVDHTRMGRFVLAWLLLAAVMGYDVSRRPDKEPTR